MPPNQHPYNPLFDEETWQWGMDSIQEKLLIRLNRLTRQYARLQQEHNQAPAHLKPAIYKRMQWLEELILEIEECTSRSRDYAGSIVIRLRMEHEQAMHQLSIDMNLTKDNLRATNDVAIALCEKLMAVNKKKHYKP